MNEVNRSYFGAGAVVLGAAAVVLGSVARDKVDLGNAAPEHIRADLRTGTLLASRDLEQREVPVDSFFLQMTELLKREYVEPIKDDAKLATGAVRGMVTSLGDSNSLFFDKDQFRAYRQSIQGIYEGIGADFVLTLDNGNAASRVPEPDSSGEIGDATQQSVASGLRIPKLTVAAVLPGGPADKAGVKAGDWVESVNSQVVVNPLLVQDLRKIQQMAQDPKSDPAELARLRSELAKKMEGSLMPMRARDKLATGTSGKLTVRWRRAGQPRTTQLDKARSAEPVFDPQSGRLRISERAVAPLKTFVAGKSAVKLDLRNNAVGDAQAVRSILAVLAPDGQYGVFANERNKQPQALTVKGGNPKPPKITLLVDASTRGAAEILALALSSKGRATLSGGKTAGARENVEIVSLPDGSGYTLVTGKYQAQAAAGGKAR